MSDKALLGDRHAAEPRSATEVAWPVGQRSVDAAVVDLAPRRRVTRRAVLVAGAAGIAVVAGVGLVAVEPFGSTGVAVAATPMVLDGELRAGRPAKQELLALAKVAAADRALPGDASTHTVRMSTWDLSARADGDRLDWAVVPEESDLVWSADRPGRLTVRAGTPFFPSDQHRDAWKRAGASVEPGTVIRDESVPAGGRRITQLGSGPSTHNFVYPLPAQPRPLLAAIKAGLPVGVDVDSTGALVTGIRDLHRETVPSPGTRAAVLRLLAERGDVVSLGLLQDRAGRSGRAFAVDTTYTGRPERQVLMFDLVTGALLASEDVLTKNVDALRVPAPAVISYALLFPAGR
nr:CU044_5270 family protein [Kribbella italica]